MSCCDSTPNEPGLIPTGTTMTITRDRFSGRVVDVEVRAISPGEPRDFTADLGNGLEVEVLSLDVQQIAR